jgi:(1->4)-alpha-D-glucan 1-alpha-D-glucosylmutase
VDRYICIHGHFYQPPRENPWLEALEVQDSAYPYHDWNERVTAECYEQNMVARILDKEGRITQIVNNYTRISFDFGPTLLAWLEYHRPNMYQSILDADQISQELFSGHGSAMAHVYNHIIMPLANRRDKVTQVVWGIRDFEYRFGRAPEGMWLAETAVDLETLDILAEHGIRFTVLSPYQANRIRLVDGGGDWEQVDGGRIDPTMAYVQRLPSGRSINLFFYDGPIARAVAFESLLDSGERFTNRLLDGFDQDRDHPQIVNIATDGETYGHHHQDGEMALAYALHVIESREDVRLTNYGEFLEQYPPLHEVEILENTAWSCAHGVGRWHRHCGCNSGKYPAWNQEWRGPLRTAFDWLRDNLATRFEETGKKLLYDPWAARDDYINVILDRSAENVAAFLARNATHTLNDSERMQCLRLMEMQRQLLLMYTSCGWFFDELSGVETVQVMQYTGRAVQLAREVFGHDEDLEPDFLAMLEQARSNLAEHRNGRYIYEKWVRPSEVDIIRVIAHYAVSSLFERYPPETDIYCYRVESQEQHRFDPGMSHIMIGRARAHSTITHNAQTFSFGVIHFGDQNVNAGVRDFDDEDAYTALVAGVTAATERGDIAEVVRLLDGYFQGLNYSVQTLFRDAQRTFLDLMLESTLQDDESTYRQLYERRVPLMHLLTSLNAPLPKALHAAAEFVVNSDLRRAIVETFPDYDQVQSILERARMWDIELDTAGFAYTLQQTIERLVSQVQEHPDDPEFITRMQTLVDMAQSMPFVVDFWKIQNLYYRMANTNYVEMQERADDGDEDARNWANQFITLGDKLGIRMTEMQDFSKTPTVASITNEILTQSRIPRVTYRFQFNPSFTFDHASELVPYLHDLGVSECYMSPIFKPRSGSTHGYDVCDHSEFNPALGGEEAFNRLSAALQEHGMSMVLDIVPNHMGIGDEANVWWMDVLENGPGSDYAHYFDIEWKPVKPELENKVLIPTLGDQYGRILENGDLQLTYNEGTFSIHYYEHKFPVAPDTYSLILSHQLEALEESLEPEDENLLEYQSIITAISYLPPRTDSDAERRVERNREKEVIKRRIDSLYQRSPEVQQAIDVAVQAFNGTVGDSHSFDLLDELIDAQSYRLAFWRVAAEEINYRRFFDINELAAIRTEFPDVFRDIHQLVFRLTTENKVAGLRIDHIDGLFDPVAYLQDLQESYVFHKVKERLSQARGAMLEDETLKKRVSGRVANWIALHHHEDQPDKPHWPLYVIAEKILGEDESLPQNWAVHGTTGYEFLATSNNLFVNSQHGEAFDSIYQWFTGRTKPFHELVNENKKMIMLVSLDSEIYALSHQLERISERNRWYRDFTLNSLTFAIREVIASLSVYRTYTTTDRVVLPRDQQFIEAAVTDAKRRNPRTYESVFDFVRETLLLSKVDDFRPEDRDVLIRWVMKFQQITGPVMAKGVEDTTFYVYNRLVSLNEVGGHPDKFGGTIAAFHRRNLNNQRFWQHTLLSTSTHDTKRSGDVRARINVLSEIPQQWQEALEHWSKLNAVKKTIEEGGNGRSMASPGRNDEYLLYQSLIGAWPFDLMEDEEQTNHPEKWANFRDRVAGYMQKATKEAKVHTSWVQPNQAYDTAVQDFVYNVLCDSPDDAFLKDIRAFVKFVAYYGQFNALAQVLLKFTAPGIPDIYQGTELWDLSLVDPDNRRPVDYDLRRRLLAELKERIAQAGDDLSPVAEELLHNSYDGRIKLYLTSRLLECRRMHEHLFAYGSYVPLDAGGPQRDHVCAFARMYEDDVAVVVAPRLVVQLTGGSQHVPMGRKVWEDTWLTLPDGVVGQRYRHLLTGEVLEVQALKGSGNGVGLYVGDILQSFPVALLEYQKQEDA